MQIIIDGKLAVIKKNTSFELVSENSLFTGADSYTLSITFPVKDCPQNMAIFGWINRKDVDIDRIVMDCWISDKSFNKFGSITIIEVTENDVKAQFLEGRSEANFDESFDDIYINELRLGYPAAADRLPSNLTPGVAWMEYPFRDEVALPWVNNTSGNMQNEARWGNNGWEWVGVTSLTFQPYLLPLIKKICQVLGYSYDFSELENSEMIFMLVCNTLPAAWNVWDYGYALPHWSVTEFFEQLEHFLFGEFVINHRLKRIAFHYHKRGIESREPVRIEKVVNAYTANISLDKGCEYIGLKNIKYAENDNRFWAYRSCQWYIKEHASEAMVFATLTQLLAFAETLKESGVYEWTTPRTGGTYCRGYIAGSDGHKLFYAQDVDQYFIMFCYDATQVKTTTVRDEEYHWYKYFNRLEPVNQFGMIEVDKEADEVEIKIVPAWIDDTDDDHGQCLFLECGEMGSVVTMEEETGGGSMVSTSGGTFGNANSMYQGGGGSRTDANLRERSSAAVVDETDYNDGALAQSQAGKAIERGEQQKSDAYFDCIYIGYWDGTNRNPGKLPFPFVHTLVTKNDFSRVDYPYTLSLQRATSSYDRSALFNIDGKKKYNFSFLSNTIPDVRAVFNIWGKNYLCEKITAQVTENGVSELMKGVFYRII